MYNLEMRYRETTFVPAGSAETTRFMNFGFSDNRSFYQVASDGGFLATPLQTNRLFLSPGARGEIVVDFSGDSGTTLSWNAYNSENPTW